MVDILVTAMQVLAGAFVAYGGVLCIWHTLSPLGAPVDDERESAFSFINANDYELGFRQLVMRRSTLTKKRRAKKLAVA